MTVLGVIIGAAVAFVVYHGTVLLYKIGQNPSSASWPIVFGWPVVGCVEYFTNRNIFMQKNHLLHGSFFEFRVLNLRIFAICDPSDVDIFLNTPETSLSFNGAVPLIMGGTVDDVDSQRQPSEINRVLHKGMSKSLFEAKFPMMVQDAVDTLESHMSQNGIVDPFVVFPELSFLTSTRMLTADSLCDHKENKKLCALMKQMDTNMPGFTSLLLYLPTTWKVWGYSALFRICATFSSLVSSRKKDTLERNDFVQTLLDSKNESVQKTIIIMLLVSLWVSTVNTASVLTWGVLQLTNRPLWIQRLVADLKEAVADQLYEGDQSKIKDLHADVKRLSMASYDKLQVLDWIITETARMAIIGNLSRRALKSGILFQDRKYEIPRGAFVVTSTAKIHYDSQVYENPNEFNPGRWEDGSLIKNHRFSFLGFGGGRHLCIGQKLARLEVKLALSLAFSKYSFEIEVNPGVKKRANTLEMNVSSLTAVEPLQQGLMLKYISQACSSDIKSLNIITQ